MISTPLILKKEQLSTVETFLDRLGSYNGSSTFMMHVSHNLRPFEGFPHQVISPPNEIQTTQFYTYTLDKTYGPKYVSVLSVVHNKKQIRLYEFKSWHCEVWVKSPFDPRWDSWAGYWMSRQATLTAIAWKIVVDGFECVKA